jgi:carboxypeptidase C (cathepsin A)
MRFAARQRGAKSETDDSTVPGEADRIARGTISATRAGGITFSLVDCGDPLGRQRIMIRSGRSLVAVTIFACFMQVGYAQDSPTSDRATSQSGNSKETRSAGTGLLSLLPPDSVTDHSLKIEGREISYRATAGTLSIFNKDGERSAAIFYTSYVAEHPTPNRPVTFVFNGGPGASSAYLHLGLVGPRILDFGPSERDGAGAKLVDNPQTWLAFTDLVLIDPINTGWSRTAKPDSAKDFFGVQQDAQVIAKTIALYLAHTGRMSSPKYLLGESYGGLRAVKVASVLQQDQGIVTSGIVMLSPLLEAPLLFGASKFALGAALQLPSLAAAELERKDAFSTDAIRSAEQFAMGEYLMTLAGPAPTGTKADAFYERVAQQTGLPVEIVRKTRGFARDEFVKRLHEHEKNVVSRYDATFAAPDPFPEADSARNDDPILEGFTRAYGGQFVSYARNELGFKTEMTYELLDGDANGKWDWGRGGRSQVSATDDLRQLLSINPSFRVLIAQGYSDLVTPYAVNKYVIEHLPDTIRGRVALQLYRGGHMLYTRQSSRIEFSADAKAFYGKQGSGLSAND